MFINFWNTVLYQPLLNALAFLISIIPGGDVGIAVILLTIFVKIILYPLSKKSIESQAVMAKLAPEINKIKAGGGSKEEQAKQTFDLYKRNKANPFSGCLLVLLQIPIIFALYYVFYKGLNFNPELIYSFVDVPREVNMMFLGFIDISQKSLILAILAGVSQYFQALFMPKPAATGAEPGSFQESLTKSMHTQMKYVFPVFIFIILYTDIFGVSLSGAVALYWITNNAFAIGQQIYVEKKKGLAIISSDNSNTKA
jgi:YidC/Oxa1 family membrane protein insertase